MRVDSLSIAMNIADMANSRNWFKPIPPTRQRRLLASQRDGIGITVDGKELLNFASNDYLGLSTDTVIKDAAIKAIQSQGLGSGASRLVSGDDPLFHQLESEMATWKGYEACLLVGSGMLTNIGLLQALADRTTYIFADKLNHASLVDGARLSGAKVRRYAHLENQKLEGLLQKYASEKRIIVSDAVFSMDGDVADVQQLLNLAEAHDALLVIDDAHGIGTVGEFGQGVIAQAGLSGNPRLIEVGTFGKAFGSYGAYVLGTHEIIEGLRQSMRTLIYSTALPVAVFSASLEALNIIKQGERSKALQANISFFLSHASGLPLLPSTTAIQPVLLGSDESALAAAEQLKDAGFFVPAIRPPTVPEGQARLRITLSAVHSQKDIRALIRALSEIVG